MSINRLSKKSVLLLIAITILLIFGCLYYLKKINAAKWQTLPVVETIVVSKSSWQSTLKTVGSLKAMQDVTLAAQVPGVVQSILFTSGQEIKAGQVLVKLESNDIESQLQQAQAVLEGDTHEYQRQKSLYDAIEPGHSKKVAVVDEALAKMKQDAANVASYQAKLQQYIITAPFDGVVGLRQLSAGQFLNVGDPIVHLTQANPMYLDFTIPERYIGHVKSGDTIQFTVSAYPAQHFQGQVLGSDGYVDSDSHAVTLRAIVQNDSHQFLSGMSALVCVLGTAQTVIHIPQVALIIDPHGFAVYVIDHNKKAHKHYLTLGERAGNDVVVLQDLQEGDVIVIAGQQKLHDGAIVSLVESSSTAKQDNPS